MSDELGKTVVSDAGFDGKTKTHFHPAVYLGVVVYGSDDMPKEVFMKRILNTPVRQEEERLYNFNKLFLMATKAFSNSSTSKEAIVKWFDQLVEDASRILEDQSESSLNKLYKLKEEEDLIELFRQVGDHHEEFRGKDREKAEPSEGKKRIIRSLETATDCIDSTMTRLFGAEKIFVGTDEGELLGIEYALDSVKSVPDGKMEHIGGG